jgi:phenylacetic acid degradation operon negative regulatory protein
MTPKSLLLDLLRVAPNRMAVPVRTLVELGRLFGFRAGTIRVVVARLTGGGLLENDARGWYRLAPETSPINEFVEQWRLGEARVCPWDRRWLVLWPAHGGSAEARRRSDRALGMLGFRAALDRAWVRPNNFARSPAATAELLVRLGLAPGSALFVADPVASALAATWSERLWPVAELEHTYRTALAALERSRERVTEMPNTNALVETFVVGGNAIRVLALDPLLPDEIMTSAGRRALTDAELRYDAVGRPLWQRVIDDAAAGRVQRPVLKRVARGPRRRVATRRRTEKRRVP